MFQEGIEMPIPAGAKTESKTYLIQIDPEIIVKILSTLVQA